MGSGHSEHQKKSHQHSKIFQTKGILGDSKQLTFLPQKIFSPPQKEKSEFKIHQFLQY